MAATIMQSKLPLFCMCVIPLQTSILVCWWIVDALQDILLLWLMSSYMHFHSLKNRKNYLKWLFFADLCSKTGYVCDCSIEKSIWLSRFTYPISYSITIFIWKTDADTQLLLRCETQGQYSDKTAVITAITSASVLMIVFWNNSLPLRIPLDEGNLLKILLI